MKIFSFYCRSQNLGIPSEHDSFLLADFIRIFFLKLDPLESSLIRLTSLEIVEDVVQ